MGDERRNANGERRYTMSGERRNTNSAQQNATDERRDVNGEKPDRNGKRPDPDDHVLCTITGSCQYKECPMRRHLSGFRPYTNKVLICRFIFKLLELLLVLAALIILAISSSEIKEACDTGYRPLHLTLPFVSAVIMAFTVILFLTVVGFCACSPITRSVDATICLLGFFLLGAVGVILLLPSMSESICNPDCKSGKSLLGIKAPEDVLYRKPNNLTDSYDDYDNDYYIFRKKRAFAKPSFIDQENYSKKHSELSKNNEIFPTVMLGSTGRKRFLEEGSTNAIEDHQRTLLTVKNNGEIIATKNNVSSLHLEQNNHEIYDKNINFNFNFIQRQFQKWIRNNTQNNKVYDCFPGKKVIRSKTNSKRTLKYEAKQKLRSLSNDNKCEDRVGEQNKIRIQKSGDSEYTRTKRNSRDLTPISGGNPEIKPANLRGQKLTGNSNSDTMTIGILCIADAILMKMDIIRMFLCGLYY